MYIYVISLTCTFFFFFLLFLSFKRSKEGIKMYVSISNRCIYIWYPVWHDVYSVYYIGWLLYLLQPPSILCKRNKIAKSFFNSSYVYVTLLLYECIWRDFRKKVYSFVLGSLARYVYWASSPRILCKDNRFSVL